MIVRHNKQNIRLFCCDQRMNEKTKKNGDLEQLLRVHSGK
jgi:hypothetical protein